MPRLRNRSPLNRRDWTDAHRMQLRTGIDFCQAAWGDVSCWPIGDRENWPGKAALREMEIAWEDLGPELVAEEKRKFGLDAMPHWFELVLDGLNPREARLLHRERSYERSGTSPQ